MMNNYQLKREFKKNLKILKLWRMGNKKMLDYNFCDKCKESKIDDVCDIREFANDDEIYICNECIKKMIENKEIIVNNDILNNELFSFTKKGIEIKIKEIQKELEILINYENRYLRELKEMEK
ncbi:MAG: hypothetical protein PVH88_08905 [Ignavibacteria bacterium]